jgi:Sec-independent protein translocase protein TatA
VGFGTEVLFILMLGMLILGPKQLHTMLGHLARAKARFEDASHGLKSQLAAELDAPEPSKKTNSTRLNWRRSGGRG